MMKELFSLITFALYIWTFIYQVQSYQRRKVNKWIWLPWVAALAWFFHAVFLDFILLDSQGFALDFFRALSLIMLCVVAVVFAFSWRLPVEPLLLVTYPLAGLSVLAATWLPVGTTTPIKPEQGLYLHILLGILAFVFLLLGGLQATLLTLQNHQFKHKKPSSWVRYFPPMQTMEQVMFYFIALGWWLLSFSLILGWVYVDDWFAQHLIHKTILSIIAWAVFGVLLMARYFGGWHGRLAVNWTLIGGALLLVAFLGSKWVREFIVHH